MPEIFAEWICRKCQKLHRVKFNLLVESPAYYRLKTEYYEQNGVRVVDAAISHRAKGGQARSAIYAEADTPVHLIIEALKEYIIKYYTMEKDTLKVDICL